MLKCNIVKYFFTCTIIISCFLVFYISITLNSCFFGNLKRIIRKHGRSAIHLLSEDAIEVIPSRNGGDTKTIVRVVPLITWNQDAGKGVRKLTLLQSVK